MNKARATNFLIGLILVGVFAFLFLKTRTIDIDGHNQIVNTLRQLKQVDSDWNVEVLKSKTGFNSNYDPVASPLPLIQELEVSLKDSTGTVWEPHRQSYGRLVPLVDDYKKSMEQKIGMVERFKSQNSILRNSSRFLPVAVGDALSAVERTPLDAQLKGRLRDTLNALLALTLNYVLTPDTGVKARIEEDRSKLESASGPLPAEVRDQIAIMLPHVATVVRQQDLGDKLLTDLVALPTGKKIDALTDAYVQEHKRLLEEQQTFRQLLTGYSAFLLALIAFLGWRLVKSYRLLNRTNGELSSANRQLKESQMQLVQSEKMSAIGQMVAGIAHEINTPLAYVKGTIDLLREQIGPFSQLVKGSDYFTRAVRAKSGDKEFVRDQFLSFEALTQQTVNNEVLESMNTLLQSSGDGITQISDLVVNLKNFSRLDRAKVDRYNVQEGLESTLLLARNMLKNRIHIERYYDNVPSITCSPSQINQVFLNIITNAAQSIPEERQGTVTLRTALDGVPETVRIEIQDDGVGIAPEVLPKIFDPFFTTKEIGSGTGLGLSISYKIIQEHGGTILVDSEVGIGTVFTILLPIVGTLERASESREVEAA